MPVEQVRYDKIDVVSCDERGRATLGSEYANEQVWVYIAELPDIDDMQEVADDGYQVLTQMTDWAINHGITPIDWESDEGVVKDKGGKRYQTPHSLDDIPEDVSRMLSMETGEPISKFHHKQER